MKSEEKIVYNQWIDCTEDNYWQTEDFDIVCWKDSSGEIFMSDRHRCTYGWNVLCRLGAKFMTVKNPF